ncbi:metallophosphoesterase [Hamadaea sp. NPDC051192]|uniref:metallophosphoesterase family protein n=1 Tax=Hamadaea sp. NPDC051192 TaxID=3154940 RepID=UPI00341F3565
MTVERTLAVGEVAGTGTAAPYHRLRFAPGEVHSTRTDFVPGPAPSGDHTVIATLGHLTDLHIVDPGTPARLDFAMRTGAGADGWGGLVDWVFRPHEALAPHAAAAMIQTLAGLDLDVCVVTGDNIDNAQTNELSAYLALLDGGRVELSPHGYHGPQRLDWADPWYWQPDPGDDRYKQMWGYPTHPGLLEAATTAFTAPGLGHPWLACLGNHDLLVGGSTATGPGRAALAALATGDGKPIALPDPETRQALQQFLTDPMTLLSGPTRTVPAVPGRAFASAADFVLAHRHPAARPAGHGFTAGNEHDGTAYYSYDPVPGLRIVVLNTDNPHGHWDGSIDKPQLDWLADQLRAQGPDDPLIVLASHHATSSLRNGYGVCPDHPGERAYADELLRLAVGCRNVILWLNGHHHANRIVAHHRGDGGGFYEVTTAAIADWPVQARTLQIARERDGGLCITSTLIDHVAPAVPGADRYTSTWLASLHRELAYNDAVRAGRTGAVGGALDRNVRLRLPARS